MSTNDWPVRKEDLDASIDATMEGASSNPQLVGWILAMEGSRPRRNAQMRANAVAEERVRVLALGISKLVNAASDDNRRIAKISRYVSLVANVPELEAGVWVSDLMVAKCDDIAPSYKDLREIVAKGWMRQILAETKP
jgi:hypothetical protein